MATLIPIASLHPFEPLQPDLEIKAEISLLWPYSSSHASCALLLVDPDFRQRHARGEIRVRFEGPVAKVLARTKIGIGDQIKLRLDGAKWRDTDSRARSLTPGKPVEAELLFENHLHLTILEDSSGGLDGRVIEFTAPPTVPIQLHDPISTPARSRASTGSVGLGTPVGLVHSSPAYMKRIRLSQELFLNSPGLHVDDPTPESASIHKRRKVSGSNGTKWTLLKEQPTIPELAQDEDLVDEEPLRNQSKSPQRERQVQPTAEISSPTREGSMAPPTLPVLPMPDSFTMAEVVMDGRGPLKPKLIPVSPRSLPIPSPFPRTPLSLSGLVSRADTPPTSNLSTIPENPPASTVPGYFDIAEAPTNDALSSARHLPSAVPVKQVVTDTEGALPVADDHDTPSSGSEADVSTNEEVPKMTMWPIEYSVSTPEPNALASLRQSGDNTPMSNLPDTSLVARVMEEEFGDTDMSGVSTPSDDQTGDPESPLPGLRFLDSAVQSALPSSRGQSPPFVPPPKTVRDQNPIVPSKLPNLNEHHPFGLDGAVTVEAARLTEDDAKAASKEPQAQASQDDEAAWEAMDEALHSLAKDSHQVQQAPGPPLASIIAPGPPGPDTMIPFTDAATQRQHAIAAESDAVTIIPPPQHDNDPTQAVRTEEEATATNESNSKELLQPMIAEQIVHALSEVNEKVSEVGHTLVNGNAQPGTMGTDTDHVEGNAKSRKRPSSRLSLVPDSLNTWFDSKSADATAAKDRRRTIHTLGTALDNTADTSRESLRKATPSPPPINRQQQSQGITTDLTYLTPLTNLETYLNQTSEKVDVLAVVTNAASEPVRAKSGQRDSYTIMGVSSPVLDDKESSEVRVEVYRPWSPSLPSAQKGDVILLRDFGVRSRGRKTYLLSGNESAWCAWKFADSQEGTEEVKGPPIEVGEAERGLVKELRVWWLERQARESKGKGKGRATL